jgi:hypothetical protein
VRDDVALFCPYCGTELALPSTPTPSKKDTGFPIAAGILTMIAASISAIVGLIGMASFIGSISYSSFPITAYVAPYYQLLFVGIFSILALAFGLTGGIFSLKRKYFAFSLIGMYIVFVSGVVTMTASALMENSSWVVGLPFGLPVVILSILSVSFTAISKSEFV